MFFPVVQTVQTSLRVTKTIQMRPIRVDKNTAFACIKPKPEEELEIRVVMFKCKRIERKDAEGCSDVFFKGYFDEKHPKQTDTNYRCFNGNCEFNYRLKFPYKVRDDTTKTFTLKAYDRDLLKSNDFIGEVQFDLTEAIHDSCITKAYYEEHLKQFNTWKDLKLEFKKEGYCFWVDIKQGERVTGKVLLQIDIATKGEADACPLGHGREAPNQHSFLPEPAGRMQVTLNPRKMVEQMIEEEFMSKCESNFCLFVCTSISIYLLSSIISINFDKHLN